MLFYIVDFYNKEFLLSTFIDVAIAFVSGFANTLIGD
jgi:hypothetical protein